MEWNLLTKILKMKKPRIYVWSKVKFHEMKNTNNIDDLNIDEYKNAAFICINDSSGDYYNQPLFAYNHPNVLTLYFDDVEQDGELSPSNKEENKAFTKNQAAKIVEFLKSNKHVETLIIHCAGGISRSGAVGRFALDYLNGDKESFKLNNSHINPNGRVLRMLNEAWRIKKSANYE